MAGGCSLVLFAKTLGNLLPALYAVPPVLESLSFLAFFLSLCPSLGLFRSVWSSGVCRAAPLGLEGTGKGRLVSTHLSGQYAPTSLYVYLVMPSRKLVPVVRPPLQEMLFLCPSYSALSRLPTREMRLQQELDSVVC